MQVAVILVSVRFLHNRHYLFFIKTTIESTSPELCYGAGRNLSGATRNLSVATKTCYIAQGAQVHAKIWQWLHLR